MKKSIVSFFLFGALLSAAPAQVSLVNAGNPGVVRGNDFVGPYTLSINGAVTAAMCMDDFLNVNIGDTWNANITGAASSDLSNTYLGNNNFNIAGYAVSSGDVYHAEAYLFSLLVMPGADRSNIQEAAWAIMNPATLGNVFSSNDVAVQGYLLAAAENYSTFDASGYSIVSEVGGQCDGAKQEFMVASTPEPASFALFGGGIALAGVARFLRRRKAQ